MWLKISETLPLRALAYWGEAQVGLTTPGVILLQARRRLTSAPPRLRVNSREPCFRLENCRAEPRLILCLAHSLQFLSLCEALALLCSRQRS